MRFVRNLTKRYPYQKSDNPDQKSDYPVSQKSVEQKPIDTQKELAKVAGVRNLTKVNR